MLNPSRAPWCLSWPLSATAFQSRVHHAVAVSAQMSDALAPRGIWRKRIRVVRELGDGATIEQQCI